MKGARNNLAGHAAEGMALRHYLRAGYEMLAERFRGTYGEIDLIMTKDHSIIFIEVKKSRSFDTAIARVSPAQLGRIMSTAQEYLAQTPAGLASDIRFDIACVNNRGQVSILENALA